MATSVNVSVAELDFDNLRGNFKRFLESRGTFTDYNFEGSGLAILIDLLAYNAHYLGIYANMIANEAFLDSAMRRDSVVSHAKSVGYIPTSTRAARAIVDIAFDDIVVDSTAIFPRGTIFSAEKNGVVYNFVTVEPFEIDTSADPATLTDLDIYEGTFKTITYIADAKVLNQRFVIPDPRVDTDHISVRVQASTSDTTGISTPWNLPIDYTMLDGEDPVFFLQEGVDGKYEIYFGDGIVGKKVEDGNVITITYLSTDGADANEIGTNLSTAFSLSSGDYTGTVVVSSASSGGASRESIESIRRNVPLHLQAQDRCVTKRDYEVTILSEYPYAESVFVWGGEEHSPPVYGKVFVVIKPRTGFVITESEKTYIRNTILKPRSVVTITPEILDPEYTYLMIDTTVQYDPTLTNLTPAEMEVMTKMAIVAYDTVELEKFDADFRFSKFVGQLDLSNTALLSNNTTVTMQKRVAATPGRSLSYTVEFGNPLYHPYDGNERVVWSESFNYKNAANEVVSATFEDDGSGNLFISTTVGDKKVTLVESIGTVDYTTGTLYLTGFLPVSLNGPKLKVHGKPNPSSDILANRTTLLKIDFSDPKAMRVKAYANKNDTAKRKR